MSLARLRTCAGAAMVLALGLLTSACDTEPAPGGLHQQVVGGDSRAGRPAFRRYGCSACHVIPGIPGATGTAGPPLDGWAQRRFIAGAIANDAESLVLFIIEPQQVRPGSAMPNLEVTEADARNMAAYLYTLR